MERYLSPILFHGPSAKQTALMKADVLGRLIREPFGEEGLKIAESREIADLLNNSPVGDVPGVLVVGPMDRASRSSQDVLLKTIEEFNGERIRPVLWATDAADVLPTIRSRCVLQWCPGELLMDEDLVYQARAVVDYALGSDIAGVIETLKDQNPRAMLEAAAKVLAEESFDDRAAELWDRIRKTLRYKDPTPTEVLSVFL